MKKSIVLTFLLILFVFLMAGCAQTGAAGYLNERGSLVDAQDSRYADESAYVFEMPDSVDKEASLLAEAYKPQAMTEEKNDERMILVYEDSVVDFYAEDQKTYAEVASKRYVRDHYNSNGFFRGYLTATIIRDIFDGPRSYGQGTQPPFSSRKAVSDYGKSMRQGSVGSKNVTGGGLFDGK